ncbi:hypothetical protein B0H15DRAFT_949480 [Mycena belliarum]|uniref:Uncharacterized protein n=1 Tax=Mycena belliarum TaxID=1033014 RepID=A0AAD6U516_9AGAR|nr:hypothetical protein B0H15DRAFT_949480 [Mycena belliae]
MWGQEKRAHLPAARPKLWLPPAALDPATAGTGFLVDRAAVSAIGADADDAPALAFRKRTPEDDVEVYGDAEALDSVRARRLPAGPAPVLGVAAGDTEPALRARDAAVAAVSELCRALGPRTGALGVWPYGGAFWAEFVVGIDEFGLEVEAPSLRRGAGPVGGTMVRAGGRSLERGGGSGAAAILRALHVLVVQVPGELRR